MSKLIYVDRLKKDILDLQDCYNGFSDTYDKACIIGVIEEQPTVEEQKWIPCSEQLPKQGQEVICQCRANIIKVLKLDADGDWYQDAEHCYMYGFVIAWMPLPEPYNERETDG